MGRMKRVEKKRTIIRREWNYTSQSYVDVPVVETYYVTEYVSGSDSYGASSSDGGYSCSSGGGE